VGIIAADYPFRRACRALKAHFLRDRFNLSLRVLAEDFVWCTAPVIGRVAVDLVIAGERDETEIGCQIELKHRAQSVEVTIFLVRSMDPRTQTDIDRP